MHTLIFFVSLLLDVTLRIAQQPDYAQRIFGQSDGAKWSDAWLFDSRIRLPILFSMQMIEAVKKAEKKKVSFRSRFTQEVNNVNDFDPAPCSSDICLYILYLLSLV